MRCVSKASLNRTGDTINPCVNGKPVHKLKKPVFCMCYCIYIYLIKRVVLKQSKSRNCIWFWLLLIKPEDIYSEGIIINGKSSALKGIFLIYLDSNT